MAGGRRHSGTVDVTAADPDASATDFLPLDDSDSSNAQHSPLNALDGNDSTSDVSMDSQSEDEDEANSPTPHIQRALAEAAVPTTSQPASNGRLDGSASKKRKSPEHSDEHPEIRSNTLDPAKKLKLEQSKEDSQGDQGSGSKADKSTLPAEIWHRIFTFCPPRILGRLLCVNRLFNVYLDSSSKIHCDRPLSLSSGVLPMLQPTAIWQASRRRFWPSMPSPLQDKTELDMWQLSLSTTCQHCHKQGTVHAKDSPEPWQSGPGQDGVAIVWAFTTRSCGTCLLTKSIKEIDILLSSSFPSTLATALPFVFVTQELHVISPATMERSQAPPNISLTKLFWSEHVEALKQEFFNVKAMGAATAEEWLKGLEGRGLERRNDALRWENWAAANGLSQMSNLLYPGYRPSVPVPLGVATGPRTTVGTGSVVQIPGLNSTSNLSRTATPSISSSQRNGITPDPFRRSSTGTASFPSGRHERTKEEVAELKAARKAEIERRALALDPPLAPSILAHIPSFQAALQIITPMDEQAWELLKSRLLAQRADAEQREKDNSAQALRQQEIDDKRNLVAAANKEVRDAVDADWDEIQAPVRARIAGFADEIIRDGWENGDKIDRNSCSKFAVEVLTYIRKRFYAEVAKDAAAARASGGAPIVDPPQGPFTQKLTLENMKWVFDIKIKPHTERHRKEIFLCNGCEVTVRYYGFEGVIQHYAAKHTTTLSIGNVVVHWRAEWPEQPPFTSEPRTAKNGFYQGQPPPTHNPYQQALSTTTPQPYQTHPKGPVQPYGAAPSYNEYPQGSHPPYQAQGYGTHPYPPADIYQPQPFPSAPGHPPGYSGPPTAPPGPPGLPGPPGPPAPYNYNYGAYQTNGQVGYQGVHPSTFSPQYRTQLEDMARIARELWNATSNMKDTLSIVRVQVVIHHLAKRFHARFGLPLPLATFIDGLSDHKDMRPVRNVNGLVCRVCHQGVGGYVASEEERRSYSLPQLTTHFQSKHVEPFVQMGQYGQPPEWTVDMVLLPEPAAVTNLRSAVSMDSQKYHLVNEAVPHLLGSVGMPEAAPNVAPAYPGQTNYHQGYQHAPASDHVTYYGQAQAGGAAETGGAGLYQNTAASTPHYPNQPPPGPYDHAGPSLDEVTPRGPASGHGIPELAVPVPAAPAPALAPVNLTLGRESERRSSQGLRQRDQNPRHNKKKNKKGAHGNDGDSLKRGEEEEKMAEEEAEREGDAIRAMWAADRAQTARKSAIPEGDKSDKPTADNTPSRRNTPSSAAAHNVSQAKASQRNAHSGNPQRPKHGSKPGTPQQRQRFQSRPRDSPSTDAASPRADVGGPNPREAAYRGHQHRLSNVIYMDGNRDEPEDYGQYNQPPLRETEPRRSRSPVYTNYSRPPAQQYRQRSPARPEHDYQYMPPRPPAPPAEELRYERPLPRDDYSYRSYPDEPVPRQRAQEVIEIEIIEYRRPDGTIWVEERPLRRIPNPESERYYRDAQPPAASYDRGDTYAVGPPRREQPPPPAQMIEEPYHPPYERSYSRAPQGPQPQPSAAGVYDPRHPSDAAPRHYPAQPQLPPPPPPPRNDAAYYEEYDPRYPAGVPPPPSAPIPTGSRAARYQ